MVCGLISEIYSSAVKHFLMTNGHLSDIQIVGFSKMWKYYRKLQDYMDSVIELDILTWINPVSWLLETPCVSMYLL